MGQAQDPLPLCSGPHPLTGSEAEAQRGSVCTEGPSSPACSWDPRGSPISLAVTSQSLCLFFISLISECKCQAQALGLLLFCSALSADAHVCISPPLALELQI